MNRIEIRIQRRGQRVRRRALNSPLRQGSAETLDYYVDFQPWGASVALPASSPVVLILDEDDDDVTHGNRVATVVVADGGTNYEEDDILTIAEAGSSGTATVKVLTVNAGVILTVELVDVGYDYTAGTKSTTGHTEDATITITVTDAGLVVKASVSVVSSYEVEFTITAVGAGKRYRVFVKATVDSLIGECWTFLDGEL